MLIISYMWHLVQIWHTQSAKQNDMKVNKQIIMVAALLVTSVFTSDGENKMSLKECMEYAISNSTKIRIQQADNDDARIARRDAILAVFTPSVYGGVDAYLGFGRSLDPETNTYVSTTTFNNGYSVSAGIDLFNGFQAVNNMKISRTAVMMGVEKEKQLEDEICLATMQAYYNVAYYSELEKILQGQVETAQCGLKRVEREEELGRKGHADVVQMAADLADREYQLINTRNKLKDAYITLKDIMFFPIGENLQIDLQEVEKWENIVTGAISEEVGSIVEQAKESLPSAIIARGAMSNAKLDLSTARWKVAPRLSLNGGWSTSYYSYPGTAGYVPHRFPTQFRNNSGEYVSLSLSIPIFDRLSRHSNIVRKKNAYARATAQFDQTMQQIEAEVLRAVADRNGASVAYMQSQKRASAQKEAFLLNQKKYEQGLISSIEYQTSSNNLLNAQAEKLNALLSFLIKKSVVSYYQGISYIYQEY